MFTISKIVFGSHLYETNIPTSDLDYRGVYLPKLNDCILGTVRDAFEDPSEEDTSIFSLQKYLRLASEGQSVAIEMLFAPENKILKKNEFWVELQKHRNMFLTRKMKSFMGFAKSMSGKYSVRVDRLNEISNLIDLIVKSGWDGSLKIKEVYELLPTSPNLCKSTNQFNKSADNRVYVVCGREFQVHATISHLLASAMDIKNSYGDRVKKAQSNEVDWKSLLHAFRVCYQCKQAAEEGTITFPCKEVQFLRDLRLGKYDIIEDGIDKKLDDLIVECDSLVMSSKYLNEEVDWGWCEEFIINCYKEIYGI